jgi:hypothetical protein
MEADVESFGIEPEPAPAKAEVKGSANRPSTLHEHARRRADPDLRYIRAKEDVRLSVEIARVHARNFGFYGARKVCLQLNREGLKVGRDRRRTDDGARAGGRRARQSGQDDRAG